MCGFHKRESDEVKMAALYPLKIKKLQGHIGNLNSLLLQFSLFQFSCARSASSFYFRCVNTYEPDKA